MVSEARARDEFILGVLAAYHAGETQVSIAARVGRSDKTISGLIAGVRKADLEHSTQGGFETQDAVLGAYRHA